MPEGYRQSVRDSTLIWSSVTNHAILCPKLYYTKQYNIHVTCYEWNYVSIELRIAIVDRHGSCIDDDD